MSMDSPWGAREQSVVPLGAGIWDACGSPVGRPWGVRGHCVAWIDHGDSLKRQKNKCRLRGEVLLTDDNGGGRPYTNIYI